MKKHPYYNAKVVSVDSNDQTVELEVYSDDYEKFPIGKTVKLVLVDEKNIASKTCQGQNCKCKNPK